MNSKGLRIKQRCQILMDLFSKIRKQTVKKAGLTVQEGLNGVVAFTVIG